jgi:predicted DNA binding CopG/RHH family protein
MKAKAKTTIPAFSSEREEARWWYENRSRLDQAFEEAAQAGKLKKVPVDVLKSRLKASRTVSIRLPEADLARARRHASEKGLPYQTYIKSLLHEALNREDKRKAS